jgi:uncharacterized protein (TIGR02271 family)
MVRERPATPFGKENGMVSQTDLNRINGLDVYGTDGDKIGSAGQVYLDDASGDPEWVSVRTGLFGTKESFVPLRNATITGDRVEVPFGKDQVKGAPQVDADGDLSPAEEQELYTHYGLSFGGREGYDAAAGTGHDTSGPNTDDAMTRSEERLVTDTRSEEAGRARLRKYVVTEQQQMEVPVRREEVRLEREPVSDANIGAATEGPDITESEHEVTLHAERPVVDTEAVPVERVRLGKETVGDTEDVQGEVRKEQIEYEGPKPDRRDRD